MQDGFGADREIEAGAEAQFPNADTLVFLCALN